MTQDLVQKIREKRIIMKKVFQEYWEKIADEADKIGSNRTLSTQEAPDFDRLLQQISELNLLAEHGTFKLVRTSNVATFKKEVPKPLSLTLYADGLILESGPFLPYTNLRVSIFLSDILDGYFPSELQLLYPKGVPFIVVDRRTTRHGGRRSVWAPFCGTGHRLDRGDSLKEAVQFGLDGRLAELIEAQNVGGEHPTDILLQGRRREECSSNVREEENLINNKMKVGKYCKGAVAKTVTEKNSEMKTNCNRFENHLPSLHRITHSKMTVLADASMQTSKLKQEVPADDVSPQHCYGLKTRRVEKLLRRSAWLQKKARGGTALSMKDPECNTLEQRQTVFAKLVIHRDLTQLGDAIKIKVLSTDGLTTCIICSLRPDQTVRELRSVLNLQGAMVDNCSRQYKLMAVDKQGHCACLRDSQPLENYGVICNSLVRMCLLPPPAFSDKCPSPGISRYTNGYWYMKDSQSKFLCSVI